MPERLADLLDRDAVAVQLNVSTAEDVIRRLASKLEANGHVRSTYVQAAIDREKTYPTGLPLGLAANVAVPHADPVHVVSPAIALATLSRPVDFANMEDPDEAVPVGVVFMLAINDKDRQIDMLQEVMALIQNPGAINDLLSADNVDDVLAVLEGRKKSSAAEDDDDDD